MGDSTDFQSLVRQARDEGDAFAFDALVRRFQDMAFGYALSLVSERTLAEDAAQEAFVEAFRCLPSLREPAAFPGWLRRLVFKHCDRATRGRSHRGTLPLRAAEDTAASGPRNDPAAFLEQRQDASRVRAAVLALPDGERETTALFYFGGCPTRQIAVFLETPEATVRTRLHRARKRLRKELSEMDMENAARDDVASRPSADRCFADSVLGEIAAEYRRQRKEDPETTDRSLLAQAKQRIEAHIHEGKSLAPETVNTGINLLKAMGEDETRVALMHHFLTQPLTVSEEAWARFWLVHALCGAGRTEEAITAQEEMYAWIQAKLAAGNPPRLRRDWDYEPVDDDDLSAQTFPADTLLLWTLYIPDMPNKWVEAGRGDEWLRLFYRTLETTPATDVNRQHRFYFLRWGVVALSNLGRFDEARQVAGRAAALADEESEPVNALHWCGHGAYLRLITAKRAGDRETFAQAADEALALLTEYARLVSTEDAARAGRFHILRDNIASILSDYGFHQQAIPLLRAEIESGSGTPWNYGRLAASVFATTSDRAEALRLLRQGALRNDRYDLWDWARTLSPFAPVADDAEFAAAAARPLREKR